MNVGIESFVAFEKATGRITSSGTSCAPALLETDVIGVLVGVSANPESDYVDTGQVVSLPPRPSENHEFDYAGKCWALNQAAAWAAVKSTRNTLLGTTDWLVVRAMETGAPLASEWAAYRQALRDITEQPDPLAITWPVPPSN